MALEFFKIVFILQMMLKKFSASLCEEILNKVMRSRFKMSEKTPATREEWRTTWNQPWFTCLITLQNTLSGFDNCIFSTRSLCYLYLTLFWDHSVSKMSLGCRHWLPSAPSKEWWRWRWRHLVLLEDVWFRPGLINVLTAGAVSKRVDVHHDNRTDFISLSCAAHS